MRYDKHEINRLVVEYQKTNNRALLDNIVKNTNGLINRFGKSFKVPYVEWNSIYGVALTKALKNWRIDGRACFSSYLSAIIINELKMFIRKKQMNFENDMLQELDEHNFETIIADDMSFDVELKTIIKDVIETFPKNETKRALKMFVDGYNVEFIVKHLSIGRTNFYADLKRFKDIMREELVNAEIYV